MRRTSTGAAHIVPLAAVEGRETARAEQPPTSTEVSPNALSRVTVLPVSIARGSAVGLGSAMPTDGIITANDAIHISGISTQLLESTRVDVVLLDVRSVRPTLTYRAIARIRGAGWQGGILLLLDGEDLAIVSVASKLGATDFVLSSASSQELEARLRREAGRRTKPLPRLSPAEPLAGIHMHWRTHQVSFEGTTISLTLREMQLLAVLLERRGEVVTPHDLASSAWGKSRRSRSGLATTYVCSLRKKLAWFGGRFGIQTVRDVGYRFVV